MTKRMFEGLQIFNGIVSVYKNTCKRVSKCACCGQPIVYGQKRIQYATPKQENGVSIHVDCCGKTWINGTAFKSNHHENDYNSLTCNNHTVEIIAPFYELPYFSTNGFDVFACNKTHRTFTADYTNGYTSGHVVPVALSHGYTVKVNGEKITTITDYYRMVGK